MSWIIRSKCTALIRNTVFFDSFLGQYNDNPKYVSECLHRQAPEIKIVWCIGDKCTEKLPDYIKTVQYGSRDYYYYAMNAAVAVDNHMGLRTFGFKKNYHRIVSSILHKKGQLCISTWHGTPLKKIGKDQLNRQVGTYYTATNYCVAGCTYTAQYVGEAFFMKEKMRLYGTPRNDLLLGKHNTDKLKRKLNLPLDRGIVIFAPTFRSSTELSGIKQIKDINVKGLLDALENKFGMPFSFVFRVHHSILKVLEGDDFLRNKDYLINGNFGDDMAEYLACADVLITDYSSSLYDFLLTEKPCFIYAPDLDNYKTIDRGMYVDIYDLPLSISIDSADLINSIMTFQKETYKKDVRRYLAELGNIEDGHASERVVNDIITHISVSN